MHRKSFPDVDSLTRCSSETRQFHGDEACEQFKRKLRETNMSASLIRRGLELFDGDFKGRSTVWAAKCHLSNIHVETRCLLITRLD